MDRVHNCILARMPPSYAEGRGPWENRTPFPKDGVFWVLQWGPPLGPAPYHTPRPSLPPPLTDELRVSQPPPS